jgi:hypothetical protein
MDVWDLPLATSNHAYLGFSQNDILGKRTIVKSPVKSLVVGALLRSVTAIS